MIDEFVTQHTALNQISPGRSKELRRVLVKLEAWHGASLLTVDDRAIRAWMTDMIEEKSANPSSCRTYLNIAKVFYKWAVAQRYYDAEAGDRIACLKPPRGYEVNAKPRPYSRAEIDQFWTDLDTRWPRAADKTIEKHIARVQKGTAKYRGRAYKHGMNLQVTAIASLALFLGLRRKEIYTLSLDAMHPDNAYLVVHGKRDDHRDKVRQVPYNDAARQAVIAWFAWRRWLAPDHDLPWLSLYSGHPSDRLNFGRFSILFGQIGDGWELHRMRHTCATQRLRNGMPIEILQKFLGHANIQQTLAYADIDHTDIERAVTASDEGFMRAMGRRAA